MFKKLKLLKFNLISATATKTKKFGVHKTGFLASVKLCKILGF